jgi:hypothetical protein
LEDSDVNRRQVLVFVVLLASLLTPAALPAAEPDCSNPQPPTGSIQVTGPQIRVGERLIVSPGARLEVTATAADGSPAPWKPMIEGREESAWPESWAAGGHTAGAVAVDGCGRSASLAPVAFVVDTEPPAIRWEAGERKVFMDTERLAPDKEPKRRRLRRASTGGRPAEDSWISEDGVLQVPLRWVRHDDPTFHTREKYPVLVVNNHPQAFLAAPGTIATVDGSDSVLGDRLLWIAAEDAGAGVERMTLRLRREKDYRAVLEVETIDHVGNTIRKEIMLRRAGPKDR